MYRPVLAHAHRMRTYVLSFLSTCMYATIIIHDSVKLTFLCVSLNSNHTDVSCYDRLPLLPLKLLMTIEIADQD